MLANPKIRMKKAQCWVLPREPRHTVLRSVRLARKRSPIVGMGFPGRLVVAGDGGGRSAYCGSRLCSARCWPSAGQGVRSGMAVVEEPALTFAGLLRQLRAEARLTQEELAEAAGLSPRSLSDLERGISRTAHKDTAQLLAGALSLAGPVRALFVAAARGKAPAAEVLAARQGVA